MKRTLEYTGNSKKFVTKDNREILSHGTDGFQMSAHKTCLPPGASIALYYHWHNELEILFMMKGKMRTLVGHNECMLTSGDILIIPANVPHMAYRETKGDIEFYAVLVHINFLSSREYDLIQDKYILPTFFGWQSISKRITRNNKQYNEIRQKIECILEFYRMEYDGYELMIKSCLYSILYYLTADSQGVEEYDYEEYNVKWVRDILSYVKSHYHQKITLTDIADSVCMSNSYLCRSMKKVFNLSPMEFINRYRVIESIKLIENTDRQLGDIAFETGFSNVNSFTSSFKKYMQSTPSQFRQKYKTHNTKKICCLLQAK